VNDGESRKDIDAKGRKSRKFSTPSSKGKIAAPRKSRERGQALSHRWGTPQRLLPCPQRINIIYGSSKGWGGCKEKRPNNLPNQPFGCVIPGYGTPSKDHKRKREGESQSSSSSAQRLAVASERGKQMSLRRHIPTGRLYEKQVARGFVRGTFLKLNAQERKTQGGEKKKKKSCQKEKKPDNLLEDIASKGEGGGGLGSRRDQFTKKKHTKDSRLTGRVLRFLREGCRKIHRSDP